MLKLNMQEHKLLWSYLLKNKVFSCIVDRKKKKERGRNFYYRFGLKNFVDLIVIFDSIKNYD